MYVISNGQKQPLNAEHYYYDEPETKRPSPSPLSVSSSPTSSSSRVGTNSTCRSPSISYERKRRSIDFYFKWIGIFLLLAVGFYYLCVSAPKKRMNFRPVRLMYRR